MLFDSYKVRKLWKEKKFAYRIQYSFYEEDSIVLRSVLNSRSNKGENPKPTCLQIWCSSLFEANIRRRQWASDIKAKKAPDTTERGVNMLTGGLARKIATKKLGAVTVAKRTIGWVDDDEKLWVHPGKNRALEIIPVCNKRCRT